MFIRNRIGRKYQAANNGDNGGGAGGGDNGTGDNSDNGAGDKGFTITQAQLDEMTADRDRLAYKLGESNRHTKAAEQKTADEARRIAAENGNFEQLFKSSEEKRLILETSLSDITKKGEKQTIRAQALSSAAKFAEGHNVEILADIMSKRLKMDEGSIKVLDNDGKLTVSKIKDLETEISGSVKFASLIKGNNSSGGGAGGSGENNGGAGSTITRAEFNAMDDVQRAKFGKDRKNKITE